MCYHSISMHTGRYPHQSCWYWRLLSSSGEVSVYLKYELHIKGTVLCLWSSLRYVKSWIVICYRGINFPHRTVVLLVLESDGPCTSLNGHCERKSAVLVLVWCYIPTGDREQDLWSYWLPEGCIKQLYDKQTYRWWLPARSVGWGEQWSTDIAVSWNLVKPSDIQSENTNYEMLIHTTFLNLHWCSR